MWGEFVKLVMNFLLNVVKLIKENLNLPWICNDPQTPPPPLPTFDLETVYSAQSTTTTEGQFNKERPHYHSSNNVSWSLIGVCVAAIGITVQVLQTSGLLNSVSFHWICMALVFSLTSVMVSIHIAGDYKVASLVVVHVGIFIVFTALVVAFVVNVKPAFKVISISVYLIGILVIFANFCKRKP